MNAPSQKSALINQAVIFIFLTWGVLLLTGCTSKGSFPTLSSQATTVPTQKATEIGSEAGEEEQFEIERLEMVENTIVNRGVEDEKVLHAMLTVPRHLFVPLEYIDQAYEDHPLPIGYGQTISQPYIVAWMTELMELKEGSRVLEIGTGSGYQAAILAELGKVEVYSIEIVPELAERSSSRLKELGYNDIHVRQGDGYFGWSEEAPFDAIIVTAAPDHLPGPLVEQLKEGGCLIIPIGPPGGYQTLWKFVLEDGEVKANNLGGVSFVPFTGEGVQQKSP